MRRHGILDVKQLMECLFDDPCNLHNHYSSLTAYGPETLQLMITVDTIFIYELLLFLGDLNGEVEEQYNYFSQILFKNDIIYNQVLRDLFVMGYQIPMFFLMNLIEEFSKKPHIERNSQERVEGGLSFVVERIDPFVVRQTFSAPRFETPKFLGRNHLLDCLYVWVIRKPLPKHKKQATKSLSLEHLADTFLTQLADTFITQQAASEKTKLRERLPSASQLSKSGIRFRAIEGSISVMHYDKRRLWFDLPRLVVYNKTEDVLRNLLAYEQTSKDGGEFTKYVVIMDSLIDTPEDVAILTKAEVIENHLGSDEKLLKLWNDMCFTVSDRRCDHWDRMIHEILHHYHTRWRTYYVELREKYFSRPWPTISLLSAFLLLLFTSVQTGYTVAGYYKPDI